MDGENKVEHKVVKTYAEDMAEVIKGDSGDLVRKIIHGEERHEEEKRNLSPQSKTNKLFLMIGLFLVFLALVIVSFLFFKKEDNIVAVEKQFLPIIFNDQSTFVEVSGLKNNEIVQSVLKEVNTMNTRIGGVKGIYLTENKQIVGLRRFISLLKGNLILDKNPVLVSDNFLIGGVLIGEKYLMPQSGDFFILLKMRSTTDVFDSMRSWENKMLTDLHDFFGIALSSQTNYLFTKNFDNGVIKNKNARILYDNNGNIILAYIYADDNSVIITNSEDAANEVMLRLASAQKKE